MPFLWSKKQREQISILAIASNLKNNWNKHVFDQN